VDHPRVVEDPVPFINKYKRAVVFMRISPRGKREGDIFAYSHLQPTSLTGDSEDYRVFFDPVALIEHENTCIVIKHTV
jgi:hypothetical protein